MKFNIISTPILSIALFCLVVGFTLLWSPIARAGELTTDLANGAAVFEAQCVGCHINGGNIIRRGKTLKLKVLQKYHLDSEAAIADLVTHGKNNMSAYGDQLSVSEIADVAAYTLEQAQNNWKN
jgi:cytochrome c6